VKIQLKRSNVLEDDAAKKPTASQMEYGEIAVNYNPTDPALFIKDSNDQIIRIAGANSSGITGYPDVEDGDGVTLDERYVKTVGSNMTGDLTFGTDKITINSSDGRIGIGTLTPGADLDVSGDVYIGDTLQIINGGNETAAGIYFAGDVNTGLFHPSPDTLAFTTGGTERLRISATGDLYASSKIHSEETTAEDSGDTLVTKSYVDNSGSVAGDGALVIKTFGEGAAATGTFTANQSSLSELTLPPIRYSDLTDKPPGNTPPGAGTLNIQTSGGASIGTFSANAATGSETVITLPASSSPPGEGTLSIESNTGEVLGTFNANAATGTNTVITLPASVAPTQPGAGLITVAQTGRSNQSFNVNQSGDQTINLNGPEDGQLKIRDSDGNVLGTFSANAASGTVTNITVPSSSGGGSTPGNGTITVTQPGIGDQTFTVNQTGNTTIALENNVPNNGTLQIYNHNDSTPASGFFSADATGTNTITLRQIEYADVSGKPSLSAVATSGAYNDLTGKPNLSTVATSGSYDDLSDLPSLSTVAETGSYNDLTNKPSIPSGVTDLSNSTSTTTVTVASSSGNNTTIPTATTTKAGVMSASQVTQLNGKLDRAGDTLTGNLTMATTAAQIIFQASDPCGIVNNTGNKLGMYANEAGGQQSFKVGYQGGYLDHNQSGIPGINYKGGGMIGMTWGSPNVTFHVNTGNAGYIQLTSSDVRLKENINPIARSGLDLINSLNPVSFSWIDGTFRYSPEDLARDADARVRYGFIADEVIDVLPQASTTPGATEENPEPIKDYCDRTILAFLTKAVQELSAENEALKARLDAAGL